MTSLKDGHVPWSFRRHYCFTSTVTLQRWVSEPSKPQSWNSVFLPTPVPISWLLTGLWDWNESCWQQKFFTEGQRSKGFKFWQSKWPKLSLVQNVFSSVFRKGFSLTCWWVLPYEMNCSAGEALKPALCAITGFHTGISFWSQPNFREGFGPDDLGGPSQPKCSTIFPAVAFLWPPFHLSTCTQLFVQHTT